jgi:hypothetical protein
VQASAFTPRWRAVAFAQMLPRTDALRWRGPPGPASSRCSIRSLRRDYALTNARGVFGSLMS